VIALAVALAVLAGSGIAIGCTGLGLVRRFALTREPRAPSLPPMTILKPLSGDEPLLEAALASACTQQYPAFQIVFGVGDPADPALEVVRRLRARFPETDIAVVVDERQHGANRKVGNLINMLPAARYNVLVIADADVHAAPDYLARLAAALARPGVGLATTLYTGLPSQGSIAAKLGATQITHVLLPGALLARALGREDCLGATMALRRETLERAGGFHALVDHLADDNVLGRLVRALGLVVALAASVPATTVPESDIPALWRHELRWARTIRALAPAQFGASILQYPLVWSAGVVLVSHCTLWSVVLFALAWLIRAIVARQIDRALGLAIPAPVWLLPLRELLAVAVLVASFLSDRVEWRGHALVADNGRTAQMPVSPKRG